MPLILDCLTLQIRYSVVSLDLMNLLDGKLFGTNIKTIDEKCGSYDLRKEQQGAYNPLAMPLDPQAQMIPGFKEGVFNMSVGDKTFLYLPSYLGYGEQGRGPIKPNTDLIFIIEMLETAE